MSTYPASLSTFWDGPEVSTQQNNLPQRNRKQTAFRKKRGQRDQWRWNQEGFNHLISAVQQTGPKLYYIAGSTILTFLEAHVAASRWKNEVRPRITASIDGSKVDLLYNTGATSSYKDKDYGPQGVPKQETLE